jgi:hypothetical protein
MIAPRIRTKVVHSKTKDAWNVVGTNLGGKYKIAGVPYVVTSDKNITEREKAEAKHHAEFISACFNNSGLIIPFIR